MENKLSSAQRHEVLAILKARFVANPARHDGLAWDAVQSRLDAHPSKLWSLHQLESTGGEPDVTAFDARTSELTFSDCSAETPKGRVSLCYDREAWESRKQNKPAGSAVEMAAAMGVEMLAEEDYIQLQRFGQFDLKTSSWVKTPAEIRALGGALFGDRRFGRVFIYHNGAESYFAARGFRASLRV